MSRFSHLRHATAEDVPAMVALADSCAEASHWTEAQYLQAVAGEGVASVRRILLVAAGGDGVLGFAVASAATALVPAEVELENLAVRPSARRQGIGEVLVRAVLGWASGLRGETCGVAGEGSARLEVRASNGAAIRLYQRLGFMQSGVRRGYYTGPVEDAVCMQRTLAGECAAGGHPATPAPVS